MLHGVFFNIIKVSREPEILVELELNPAHPVYKGHFATQPVAPGVCLTQMFKEVLMHLTGEKLFFEQGDNIRFNSLLDPNVNPNAIFKVEYNQESEGLFKAKGVLVHEKTKFFTIQGKFRVRD
jgi:3-hydroxyacyl-[acyl-carrier-protein] dehydratase